jgi:hypothetical protein
MIMKKYSRRQILDYMFKSSLVGASIGRLGSNTAYAGPNGSAYMGSLSVNNMASVSPINQVQLAADWESLNPGYWKIFDGRLRRATTAFGDRARNTGFPFHYESRTNPNGKMSVDYDPSLPLSIMWNRKWKLAKQFSVQLTVQVHQLTSLQQPDDDPNWKMYQPNYGLFGIALGGKTQFEGFYASADACPLFVVKENGVFGLMHHSGHDVLQMDDNSVGKVSSLKLDDQLTLSLRVDGTNLSASLQINDGEIVSKEWQAKGKNLTGFLGVASRGLLDISVQNMFVDSQDNQPLNAPLNDCHVCYALGDSLKQTDKGWQVRFVGLFRTPGEKIEIKVAADASPTGGWQAIVVAGQAVTVSNEFRDNTAIVDVTLPFNPADKSQYFTVWKDGKDVTPDPRIGTDSVGPGTGLVGDVPSSGLYVGRLPQLSAPYRLCGLSCHAINTASKAELPDSGGGHCGPMIVGSEASSCGITKPFYVHDQPCYKAFQHLDEFNFQVMLWEDDVWYMELLLYPPSTKDAYKVITTSIAGPTTRWQMMRHWNVLNPGDHDHGMDDVKGPEQLLVRNIEGLGQDRDYMVRNFQIVSHLMTGKENPSGTDNPKRWRKWKMPNRDFSLLVMDSRLWRTSQDTAIWADEGWGHNRELYSRLDPTRTLLGEEQYAWLQDELTTDSSPLMCLTGINALHSIWGGHDGQDWTNSVLERDRVSADYASWVKVGADRVLDLISNREGVVSVYGDVHAGSIVRNRNNRVFECSFGPIGRWGGRSLVEGFGPYMKDFDGRELDCLALYHHEYSNPRLDKQPDVNYWNFLEMIFDPQSNEPVISMGLRNITDRPNAPIRGGSGINIKVSETGKIPEAQVSPATSLANADLLFLSAQGLPIRGSRSRSDGAIPITRLVGIKPGERVVMLAISNDKTVSQSLIATTVIM